MNTAQTSMRSKSVSRAYQLNQNMHERMIAIQNLVTDDGVYCGKVVKSKINSLYLKQSIGFSTVFIN